ncbi:MAG: shikimate kinase [Candidatus Omnitrophota bacterium]
MKNIILVGFMGTGKTAAAKAFSETTGMPYFSSDELIEKREGRAISEIFREEGESYFRKIEKQVIEQLSGKGGQIIDAGGGVVLDEENIINLKKNGIMISLWADPEVIYQRTKTSGERPILNVPDPRKKIKELLEHRKPFYEKADFHIDTTNLKVAEIVEKINEIARKGIKRNSPI